MAQEIKDLIERIQKEGIEAARAKAREIEEEARRRAGLIVAEAKNEAARMTDEAHEKNAEFEASTKELLKQAGRDLLLSLRQEINAMLERIVVARVREVLTPDEMAKDIHELIRANAAKEGVVVLAAAGDAQKLEEIFFADLKEKTRQGIVLRASDDIGAGFLISYDGGRSHYDFTDQALAAYIGASLKPKLNDLLQGL